MFGNDRLEPYVILITIFEGKNPFWYEKILVWWVVVVGGVESKSSVQLRPTLNNKSREIL